LKERRYKMTGKVSIRRQPLRASAVEVALEKRAAGMKRAVVPAIGSTAEIVVKKGASGTAYAGKTQIVVRRMGRGGPTETSSRAKALKACGGKRGCEFVGCVKSALGRVPYNLAKACPTTA
jgi:hypothetical protein